MTNQREEKNLKAPSYISVPTLPPQHSQALRKTRLHSGLYPVSGADIPGIPTTQIAAEIFCARVGYILHDSRIQTQPLARKFYAALGQLSKPPPPVFETAPEPGVRNTDGSELALEPLVNSGAYPRPLRQNCPPQHTQRSSNPSRAGVYPGSG